MRSHKMLSKLLNIFKPSTSTPNIEPSLIGNMVTHIVLRNAFPNAHFAKTCFVFGIKKDTQESQSIFAESSKLLGLDLDSTSLKAMSSKKLGFDIAVNDFFVKDVIEIIISPQEEDFNPEQLKQILSLDQKLREFSQDSLLPKRQISSIEPGLPDGQLYAFLERHPYIDYIPMQSGSVDLPGNFKIPLDSPDKIKDYLKLKMNFEDANPSFVSNDKIKVDWIESYEKTYLNFSTTQCSWRISPSVTRMMEEILSIY